jgi:hypothetical protein
VLVLLYVAAEDMSGVEVEVIVLMLLGSFRTRSGEDHCGGVGLISELHLQMEWKGHCMLLLLLLVMLLSSVLYSMVVLSEMMVISGVVVWQERLNQ